MLPSGLTADLAPPAERTALQKLHPQARTVARLMVGACSCDLVRQRLTDSIEDERELRARYQQLRLPRATVIKELDRHRMGPVPRPLPSDGWASAVARFVAEHARNAGPTLYQLEFRPQSTGGGPTRWTGSTTCPVREVTQRPGGWLEEGIPILVV